jgi:hypothetical protein
MDEPAARQLGGCHGASSSCAARAASTRTFFWQELLQAVKIQRRAAQVVDYEPCDQLQPHARDGAQHRHFGEQPVGHVIAAGETVAHGSSAAEATRR